MEITNGIGNLLQAQMAIKSANMMYSTQTGMDNEKQEINTEIMLDGRSTTTKDNKLNQISNQTTKIESYFSGAIQTAQQEVTKAQQDQQSSNVDMDNQETQTATNTENAQTAKSDSSSKSSQDRDAESSNSQNMSLYTSSGNTYVDTENTNHKIDTAV